MDPVFRVWAQETTSPTDCNCDVSRTQTWTMNICKSQNFFPEDRFWTNCHPPSIMISPLPGKFWARRMKATKMKEAILMASGASGKVMGDMRKLDSIFYQGKLIKICSALLNGLWVNLGVSCSLAWTIFMLHWTMCRLVITFLFKSH